MNWKYLADNKTDLPAVKYFLGAALPAGAPVALVLPLQPLAGEGGAGGLQELVLDGGDRGLYHQGNQETESRSTEGNFSDQMKVQLW